MCVSGAGSFHQKNECAKTVAMFGQRCSDIAGALREGPQRLNLITAIEDDFILERIDVFTVELDDGFVFRVEGASGYGTSEYQIEQAWELVSLFGMFWESDGMLRNDVGTIKPSLTVVVDGRRYIAPYELMVRLAERNVTQAEWMSLAKA